jgi:AcrR family transcriptional regulator
MKAQVGKLRSDARRNRERIVEAGRQLFSDSADVPMYEVARRAGVGQATLYRHFPDRYALIKAITELEFAGLAELAAQQADQPDGVIVLLKDLTRRLAGLRGLVEVIRSEALDADRANRHGDLGALFDKPLVASKAAGRVRADLELDDIVCMIVMIEGAVVDEPDPARRRFTGARAQELLINGLRPRQPGAPRKSGEAGGP